MSDHEQLRRQVRQRLIEENEFPPIPADWGVERLRFLFTESKERNGKSPVGDMLSVSEYRGVVPREYEHEEQRRTDEELENYRVVRPGQLAVNSMWLNHLGLGVSEHTGHVSPAYNVYDISKRLDRRFVHHLMRSNYYLKIYLRYLYGIRPNSFQIKSNDWASIPIIVPDLATQRQLADFLDRETARIDLLIEKKQRLVALLGERKTIELEKLLFESGFHIRKLRREARVISKGTTPSTIGAEMVDDGVRFLKAENVTWNGVSTSPENFISEETHRALKRSSLQPGDVLVVIAGATTGKTAVMSAELTPANTNQAVSFVRLRDPRYAEIVCAAIGCPRIQRDILLTSVQSAQPNLSMEDLGKLMLPFPVEAEISTVFEQVTAINSRSALLIAATETSIDHLKEYRSALITAAVTGQIDVPTYAKSGTPDRRLDAIQEEMGA